MWPSTSCPLSSLTRNMVLGRASVTSPSISIFSSFGTRPSLGGGPAPAPDRGAGASDLCDVYRLRTLVARLLVIGDLGVLLERLEAASVDACVMDEEVPVALIGGDEAVALLVVEPLHGSGRHL